MTASKPPRARISGNLSGQWKGGNGAARSTSASGSGYRARRQGGAVAGDLAGRRHPERVAPLQDVTHRLAQGVQPERLTDDERMQRDAEHQRPLARLLEQLVELVDHHVG